MLNTISGLLSGGVAPTDYESIQTYTIGAGGSSGITFSSIPSTYSHLQVRYHARGASAVLGLNITVNSDTATNYSFHYLEGNGTAASASASVSSAPTYIGYIAASSYGANILGTVVIDILDYENTNKYKKIRCLSGVDNNGSGYVTLASANWRNTAAITSITLTPQGSTNFAQYSSIALYGIK
jgi:hypothetical protein